MASYHLTAKIGAKGKAASHAAYISREGKYSGRERYEDLEATGYGNMPKWAEHAPANFWIAADEYERANGSAYREIEVALPRELTPDERRGLVEDFVRRELGDQHVYQWAIHTPKAALEKGEQPHAHIMYSERRLDGIERDPDQFFKRYNAKNPEKGGAQKASGGKARGEMKQELLELRERWADVQNIHLQLNGHDVRVDHRSLKDQGLDREPEKHLGGVGVRSLAPRDVFALLEHRTAEGEKERAQRAVSSLIDLSGDLSSAIADRQAQERARKVEAAMAAKARIEASKAPEVSPMAPQIDFKAALIAEVGRMTRGQAECFEKDGIRSTGTVFAVNERFAAQDTGRLRVRIMDRTQIPVALGEWTVEVSGAIKAGQLRDGGRRLQQIYGKGVTEQLDQAPNHVQDPTLGKRQGIGR